ncbi:MAG: FAD-dependent monooxygenase [Proteobacteria bacterium]|nr:FAD-dependent monooxygenase [Pseudomonadota bacterium]
MIRDVGIAGCGVAGLACAALLRRQGLRAVVYDKLETPQPLGSGLILQPAGLHVLDEIGAGDRIRALGAVIERLFGRVTPSQSVVLDVRYDAFGRDAPTGVAVHRGALFQVLYDAAREAGAEIVAGREIVGASDGRFAFATGEQSPRFDLLIDALGVRSPLSEAPKANLPYGALWASLDWQAGFDPHALEQRYEAARKMAGVLPIGTLPGKQNQQAAFFWSLRGKDEAAWRAASIDAWKSQVLALWPETHGFLDQIERHDDLVFARYAHRTCASPLSQHVVHAGDSWHCTSPQLGQGANMALLDALALATALGSQSNLDAALGEYERMRLWHIRLYQTASFLFTPAYQSESTLIAGLRDWLMSPLSRVPPAPQILAGLVAGAWGSPLNALASVKRR